MQTSDLNRMIRSISTNFSFTRRPMDNFSIFEKKDHDAEKAGILTQKVTVALLQFFHSYSHAAKESSTPEEILAWFNTFFKILAEQAIHVPSFEPYHAALRKPFDFYKFGNDFIRPLVDRSKSKIVGHDHIKEITTSLE